MRGPGRLRGLGQSRARGVGSKLADAGGQWNSCANLTCAGFRRIGSRPSSLPSRIGTAGAGRVAPPAAKVPILRRIRVPADAGRPCGLGRKIGLSSAGAATCSGRNSVDFVLEIRLPTFWAEPVQEGIPMSEDQYWTKPLTTTASDPAGDNQSSRTAGDHGPILIHPAFPKWRVV